MDVTLEKIKKAREVIQNEIYRTPLLQSKSLKCVRNNQVFFKPENIQKTGY